MTLFKVAPLTESPRAGSADLPQFWTLVGIAAAWYAENLPGEPISLAGPMALAANILLVRCGMRPIHTIKRPAGWTAPPPFCGAGVKMSEYELIPEGRIPKSAGRVYPDAAPAGAAAVEDTTAAAEDITAAAEDHAASEEGIHWVAYAADFSFDLWSDPLPANGELDFKQIQQRSALYSEVLAPFSVRVRIG